VDGSIGLREAAAQARSKRFQNTDREKRMIRTRDMLHLLWAWRKPHVSRMIAATRV
jgi:hypothetical protein